MGRPLRGGNLRTLLPLLLLSLASPAVAAEAPVMEGTWIAQFHLVIATRIPLLGRLRSRTKQSMILTVHKTDRGFVAEQQLCFVDIKNPMARASVPDAWIKSVKPRSWSGFVFPTPQGWSVSADLGVAATGYDPALGDLPVEATDPSVIDHDGDGHPGMTLSVTHPLTGRGQVYLASRTRWKILGTLTADSAQGTLQVDEASQSILGASHRLLASRMTSKPVDGASSFELTRVPEGSGCSVITEEMAKL